MSNEKETLEDLFVKWKLQSFNSRYAIIDEISQFAIKWKLSASDDDTKEDARTMKIVSAILKKLNER